MCTKNLLFSINGSRISWNCYLIIATQTQKWSCLADRAHTCFTPNSRELSACKQTKKHTHTPTQIASLSIINRPLSFYELLGCVHHFGLTESGSVKGKKEKRKGKKEEEEEREREREIMRKYRVPQVDRTRIWAQSFQSDMGNCRARAR